MLPIFELKQNWVEMEPRLMVRLENMLMDRNFRLPSVVDSFIDNVAHKIMKMSKIECCYSISYQDIHYLN